MALDRRHGSLKCTVDNVAHTNLGLVLNLASLVPSLVGPVEFVRDRRRKKLVTNGMQMSRSSVISGHLGPIRIRYGWENLQSGRSSLPDILELSNIVPESSNSPHTMFLLQDDITIIIIALLSLWYHQTYLDREPIVGNAVKAVLFRYQLQEDDRVLYTVTGLKRRVFDALVD